MKKCKVGIHQNCVELSSGQIRLAVTTEVGPRIIGCYIGKSRKNQFVVLPATPEEKPDNGFCLYGGHRLWHSPEECPRTYEPDNEPVKVTEYETGVEFASAPNPKTGIAKKIMIEPLNNGLIVVTHTIENCGVWPVELAPWALSMMAPGGTAIIPQGVDKEANPYIPDRQLNLWCYTDLKDPRLELGSQYIMVKQDSKAKTRIKVGYNDESGWIAYVNNGCALVKYFDYDPDGDYPDNNSSVECYTCNRFTEIETLGELQTLEPGECVQHVEYWQGIDGLPEINSEDDVEEYLIPHMLVGDCGCGCEDDDCDCGCDCEDDDCDCGCHDDDCDCGCHHEK